MSLQDRLSSQDPLQLLGTGASIALVVAASRSGSSYNFPLMLFGLVAHEMHSSTTIFRQFLMLLLSSFLFDAFEFLFSPPSGFMYLFFILLFLLKIPIFFSGLARLRERGGDLRIGDGLRGMSMPGAAVGGNWSMPGAFGQAPSQGQGQTASTPQPAGQFPQGGFRLGGEDEEQGHSTAPGPGRGGYEAIA
ncbi:hypothetical protein P7C73_g5179, partial [Tremellales sp. Uapishka_1]